jgi:hypothetical protein
MRLSKHGSGTSRLVTHPIAFLFCMCIALLTFISLISPAHAQSVQSLQLVPSTITGGTGGTSTGIVTLNAPAPAGGAVIQLDSSNPELAASVPRVTVPAGQTKANFIVASNAQYRRYSGLAFTAAISATNPQAGRSASATLNVTAQARPTETVYAPPSSGEGPRCGAGEMGLLFKGETGVLWNCASGTDAQCTFRQECTLGCETRPATSRRSQDVCASAGSVPIALAPKRIVGGHPGAGTLRLSAGAPPGSVGAVSTNSLVAGPPHQQRFVDMNFAPGATSLSFDLFTAAVNGIQFGPMRGEVVIPQRQRDGSIFYMSRSARAWAAVVPGTPPPVRLLSLNLDSTRIPGGQPTFGKSCIDQLFPAPDVGSIPLILSSSHPSVASVLPSPMNQGTDCRTFTVDTKAVAADTTVTISAQLGAQLLTFPLRLTAASGAKQVNSFFLDPLSVTGGASSQGTLVLDGIAPSSGFLVTLSDDNPAAVTIPQSVTVPAGTDRVNFSIATQSVSADVLVTFQASPAAAGLVAQLTVLAAAATPTLTALTVNPTSVTGGTASTAIVTLSGAAPAGGTVVNLSSNSAAAPVPSLVTVGAGATTAQFVVNTTSVTANTTATLSATLGGTGNFTVTKIATLAVTPGTQPAPGALAAPTLSSPANDARLSVGQTITFDWGDVTAAASYVIQVAPSNTFGAPLMLNQSGLTASQYSTSTLPGSRPYWRVRAVDANGNPGAWSAVRRIRIE